MIAADTMFSVSYCSANANSAIQRQPLGMTARMINVHSG
jgi:hypothetical protein